MPLCVRDGLEEEALRNICRDKVREALGKLPEPDAGLINLLYFKEVTVTDAAKMCNCSRKTIQNRRRRIRGIRAYPAGTGHTGGIFLNKNVCSYFTTLCRKVGTANVNCFSLFLFKERFRAVFNVFKHIRHAAAEDGTELVDRVCGDALPMFDRIISRTWEATFLQLIRTDLFFFHSPE